MNWMKKPGRETRKSGNRHLRKIPWRRTRLLPPLAAGLLLFLCGLPPAPAATYWYVATNGSDDVANPGTEWTTALLTISNAVERAGDQDTVLVSNGTYTIASEIIVRKGITITSLLGRAATFINGNFPNTTNRCLYLGHPEAVVDGFTLSNGYAKGLAPNNYGGGVFMTNGALRNCAISGNAATNNFMKGGGLYITNGLVTNCLIAGNGVCNNVNSSGGGAYVEGGGLLRNCVISNNLTFKYGGGVSVVNGGAVAASFICDNNETAASASGFGAGAYIASGGTVTDCVISNNHGNSTGPGAFVADGGILRDSQVLCNNGYIGGIGLNAGGLASNCIISSNAGANGGGVRFSSGGTIQDCIVEGNYCTTYGGGIYFSYGGLALNCTIRNNITDIHGGGAYLNSGGQLRNCLITGNCSTSSVDRRGGGVALINTGTATNSVVACTIVSNRAATSGLGGGGIYDQTTTGDNSIRNCIIYNNYGPVGYEDVRIWVGVAQWNNNCAPVVLSGSGNSTNPPQFQAAETGNYRLKADSPCINTGSNEAWMSEAQDMDKHRRLDGFSGRVDMGAFEFVPACSLFIMR